MEQIVLFSQYSFESFAPAALTLVIFIYLVLKKKSDNTHRFLCYYFLAAFLYEAGHFITYSVYSPVGAYGWYLTAFAPFGLVFLIQFAYSFSPQILKRESLIVFLISLIISFAVYLEYMFFAVRNGISFSETGYAPAYISKLIPIAVLIFYGWTIIVFVRIVIYEEKHNVSANIFKRFLFPLTNSGKTARNFAYLVSLDLLKVILLSTYIFFKALPYVTIISAVTALFLIAYTLYVVVYIRSDIYKLSLRFKITGSVFILNIIIFSVMGYVALSQFESSYDERRIVELQYLIEEIRLGDFSNAPEEVDYILKISHPEYKRVFSRITKFQKPESLELYDFTPGQWSFSNTEQKIYPEDAIEMKRYFVQLENNNFNQYIINVDGIKYGVGYNYYDYRKAANKPAFKLILVSIFLSVGILFLIPFSISRFSAYTDNEKFEPDVKADTGEDIDDEDSEKEYIITPDTRQKIKKAEDYIFENYMNDLSRESVADEVDMSPGRFGRAFIICTGKKVREYTNDVRIDKAKVMLEGDAAIINIAFSVGFESLSTFSRAFNKNCGITPTAYREKILKK